jgi:hypothetical protein
VAERVRVRPISNDEGNRLLRIAIVLANFSPHRSTKTNTRVGDWAAANNFPLALRPVLRLLAQPDRAAVHLAAVLRCFTEVGRPVLPNSTAAGKVLLA